MASEQVDALLTPDHIVQFLDFFSSTRPLSKREIRDRLLQSADALPGVDSTLLLLIDTKTNAARFAWHGLDGEITEGDRLELDNLPWKQALDHCAPWREADQQTIPLSQLPPLEAPFVDRCLLPIKTHDRWHSMLILQSKTNNLFTDWTPSLLQLLIQCTGQHIANNEQIRQLEGQLSKLTQDNAQSPPSLEGILQASSAVLARTSPIATYLQHNADTLQGYLRTLHQTLDYYYDEIKLNAPPEGIERVQNFAKYGRLKEIRADLDVLVEDSTEGIFQLRYFLDRLRELHTSSSMSEQLSFDQILDPVFPLLLSDIAIHIDRPPLDDLPLYGNRTQLQQLMLMMFYTIREHVDLNAPAPHIEINAEEVDEMLYFSVSYPIADSTPNHDSPEYLFIKRVMEEHQGTFINQTSDGIHQLTLGFPVMFSESDGEPQHFSMDALELPALDSIAAAPPEPTHNDRPGGRPKLLILGTDQRYLRSLRRVLAPSFETFLAGSNQAALDTVQAHKDLALLLCDLQEGADESLAFLEEMENRDPQMVAHICFLIGEKMPPAAQTLAHRAAMRTCYRHTPLKELETFIQRRLRIV